MVSYGCQNELPQTWFLKNDRNLFSQSSGGQESEIKVSQGCASSQVSGEHQFLASCHFWWLEEFLGWWVHQFHLCLVVTWPPLLSVSPPCVSYKDTCHWIMAHLDNPGCSSHFKILNLITRAPFPPIWSHSPFPWIRIWTYLFGAPPFMLLWQ